MTSPLALMSIRPLQFGRLDPVTNTFGHVRRSRVHQGWDLTATPGTAVVAIADGGLTSGFSMSYGTWLSLKFDYKGKTYFAFYAHLMKFFMSDVSVTEGSIIGLTGRSGNASTIPSAAEAHLHFEIRTAEHPRSGLADRIDPGEILGYGVYSSPAP